MRGIGKEAIVYYREAELKELLRRHMLNDSTEVSRVEAIGALNFLTVDDIPVEREGSQSPARVSSDFPFATACRSFPPFESHRTIPFSGK